MKLPVKNKYNKYEYVNTTYLMVIISIFVFFIRFANIIFGINFTDESSYIVIPYRFALGELPFINELLPHQTSGILLAPIYKLYLYLNGSNSGIVIFSRFLYSIISLVFAIYIYKSLRKELPKFTSWLATLLYISFVPFGIHALSYNSIVMFLFSYHIIELYKYLMKDNELKTLSVLSLVITNCIAVFVYPTIVIPIVISLFIFISIYKYKLRFFLTYVSGILSVILGLYCLLSGYDFIPLLNVKNYSESLAAMNWGGGMGKFYEILNYLYWVSLFPYSLVLLFLPKLFLGRDDFNEIFYLSQISLIIIGVIFFWGEYPGTIQCFMGVNGLLSLLIYRNHFKFSNGIYLLSLSSLAGGICTAWTSGNGSLNFIVGFSGSIISYIYIVNSLRKERDKRCYLNECCSFLICGLIVILFIKDLVFNYWGEDFDKLTTLVSEGPYKGIYSDLESVNFLKDITNDIDKLPHNVSSIFFDHSFPAGHLLTSLPSASCTSWMILNRPSWIPTRDVGIVPSLSYREIYRDCILSHLSNSVAAVNVDYISQSVNYDSEPIHKLIEEYKNNKFEIKNKYYIIFILNSNKS